MPPAELCFETTAAHSTICPKPSALSAFSLFEEQALNFDPPLYILHFTIYTTFHREATLKTALELLDHSVKIRSHTRYNNTRVYQIHKEGGVANRFSTARRHFCTPWSERTHCMENGQSVFFLSACEARPLRARKTLTPRFSDFFTDFEKKPDCFAVYIKSYSPAVSIPITAKYYRIPQYQSGYRE